MPVANSREKKRKRSSKSPLTAKREPFKMANQLQSTPTGLGAFDAALEDAAGSRAYSERRTKLLLQEHRKPWDNAARGTANIDEKIAGEIIRQIREFERVSPLVFGNVPSEQLPPKEARDMGGQFLTNKSRIENRSMLFDISKEVPKGALLHLHFNAELHPERLLEECRNVPAMFIRSLKSTLR